MFPTQLPQTVPDELIRCRDSSQFITEEQDSQNENTKADTALTQEVDRALWKDDVLRAMDYNEVDILVRNRIIYLNGHIVSTTSKSRIEKAIRFIPGIRGLKNNLVLDDMLTIEVASSLGELEHTYNCKFFTGVSHGVVSLNGIVSDENVKFLAEKCAASNPNVRGVINCICVQGNNQDLQDQPLLQPTIGEEILFLDGVSGVVKQVVINPNNRRVVAMTVWGRFADQRQELKSLNNNETRSPERLIVLSMDLVRYLTKFSGFLNIRSNERNRYKDFDPASFRTPNVGWTPPYPYCPEDVLFPMENQQMDNNPRANVSNRSPSTVKLGEVLTEQLLVNDSLGG